MTPPDTNLEKQKNRHGPVYYLLMAAIAIFVIGALIFIAAPLGPDTDDDAVPETQVGQ